MISSIVSMPDIRKFIYTTATFLFLYEFFNSLLAGMVSGTYEISIIMEVMEADS